jgi:hypothetical protein
MAAARGAGAIEKRIAAENGATVAIMQIAASGTAVSGAMAAVMAASVATVGTEAVSAATAAGMVVVSGGMVTAAVLSGDMAGKAAGAILVSSGGNRRLTGTAEAAAAIGQRAVGMAVAAAAEMADITSKVVVAGSVDVTKAGVRAAQAADQGSLPGQRLRTRWTFAARL